MLHDILIDFPGSQDGRFTEQFKAGTQADLSVYLAAIVVPAGWARLVESESDAAPPADAATKEVPAERQKRARK
jgi:hypothetical protein